MIESATIEHSACKLIRHIQPTGLADFRQITGIGAEINPAAYGDAIFMRTLPGQCNDIGVDGLTQCGVKRAA